MGVMEAVTVGLSVTKPFPHAQPGRLRACPVPWTKNSVLLSTVITACIAPGTGGPSGPKPQIPRNAVHFMGLLTACNSRSHDLQR